MACPGAWKTRSDERSDGRCHGKGSKRLFRNAEMNKPKDPVPTESQPASDLIDRRIAELGDWRGATLARMRALIKEAAPDVVEEWKWRGTPTWSHGGILCTGESYKNVVKLTFAKGALLDDPAGLFNASLEGNIRRAIDIREGEEIDGGEFKSLIRRAVALNAAGVNAKSKAAK